MSAVSLQYRPILPGDLDDVTEIARDALPRDPVRASLIDEKIFGDPCLDPGCSFVCVDGNRVAAFAPVAVCNHGNPSGPRTAYVKLFATRPGYRERGIMSRLFENLETILAERGVDRVRIMDHGHNYLTPGVDVHATAAHCFLWKMGYERAGEGINLAADLDRADFDLDGKIVALRECGIEVRRACPTDVEALRSLLVRHWAAWDLEVSRTFENDPVSTHIALSGTEVVAFASCEGNNRGAGSFGPMGTDPEFRRRGIAEVLCLLALRDIRDMGRRRAVIPWVGPVRFYSRVCGAEIDRVFWRYEKRIGAAAGGG